MNAQYAVEIMDRETGEIVRTFSPRDERKAGKLAAGISINLDHDRFEVRIVTAQAVEERAP